MPPLSDDKYTALKASIAERGVLTPITIDQYGDVIDGHNRKEIAGSLNVGYETTIVNVPNDDIGIEIAVEMNAAQRELTKEQRIQLELDLRKRDWSFRRIASKIGVDERTVRRDVGEAAESESPAAHAAGESGNSDNQDMPTQVEGADNKTYPATKRIYGDEDREYARKLLDEGWSVVDAAEEIGCAPNSIYKWKKTWEAETVKEKRAKKEARKQVDVAVEQRRAAEQIRVDMLYVILERLATKLGDPSEVVKLIPSVQQHRIDSYLTEAQVWLDSFSSKWRSE